MDIEGWECGVLKKLQDELPNIPVAAIEFHVMETTSRLQMIFFPYVFWQRLKIIEKPL